MKVKRIRYSRKKIFVGLFLFLFILGIGIGYAYVNSDLEILGIANVKDAKWDIHFDNYSLQTGSVTPTSNPTITDTTITFAASLSDPGEYYEFTIDVENEGTINAILSSFTVTPDFSLVDYINSSITYSDGSAINVGDVLRAEKSKTLKVKLEYIDGLNEEVYPSSNQIYNVTVSLGYTQYVDPIKTFTLPQGKTVDTLALGDELCLDDQCFNFMKYDGDDVVMLTKWNLKVGDIYNGGTKTGEYTSSDPGYGLQSSEARGLVLGSSYNGVTIFSSDKYWSTAQDDVYDPINHAGEPGTNTFSIAYYVKQYKAKLENDYHGLIKSARLMKHEEARDENVGGCYYDSTIYGDRCPTTGSNAFITNTSYWLSTKYLSSNIRAITTEGYGLTTHYSYETGQFGVRPVIIVEKNNL